MTNLTPLRNFIQEPHCDLGDNAWRLADLVRTMRNKRFIDLGVRLCLLYTSPSPRDLSTSRMPSSA